MNKPKRIPTFLALIILLVATITGVYLTSKTTFFSPKAASSCSPINIQITNLTYKSMDLSFITTKSCEVILDIDGVIYTDIRSIASSKSHYFQVDNLNPQTNYQYKFLSEGNTYQNSNYQVQTFAKLDLDQPDTPLSWGRVFTADSKPASGAIVYLNIPNAYPLSSYVTNQGYWNIPLSYCYNLEGTSWFTLPPDIEEDVIAMSVDGQLTVLTGNTSSNNPVPDIVLGQDHFQPTTSPVDYTTLPLQDKNSSSTQTKLNLTNPKEGEAINSLKPQFFGQGPAGVDLNIELNSQLNQTGLVTVNGDGSWQWTPPQDIEPGSHTIKITYTNPITKTLETITRNFTVLAQVDNIPAFTASNSAQPNTPTPSPIPPTPTKLPTKAPILTSTPTPTPQLPVTGNTTITIAVILVSILTIAISIIFI